MPSVPARGVPAGGGGAAVAVRSLTVGYGGVTALSEVSFELSSGQSLAIIGPSGAGKSSLLRCLGGLLAPSEGSVIVGGKDLWALPGRQRTKVRRRLVGFVTQGSDLVPELRIGENVALPMRLLGHPASEAAAAAARRLSQFGIEHLERRFPDEVSGGERQRAAIARALVHDPAVVLADEPTGALDEQNRERVAAALFDAARKTGSALIVVTHDERIAGGAGRVITLDGGRLRTSTIA